MPTTETQTETRRESDFESLMEERKEYERIIDHFQEQIDRVDELIKRQQLKEQG